MSRAEPMSTASRLKIYSRGRRRGNQGIWALTPAQRRRLQHKANRAGKET